MFTICSAVCLPAASATQAAGLGAVASQILTSRLRRSARDAEARKRGCGCSDFGAERTQVGRQEVACRPPPSASD